MTVSYVTTRPANQLTLERCKSVALQCKRSLPGEWPHVSKCGLKDTGQEGVGKTVKASCLNLVGQHMNVARYTLAPYARQWSQAMRGMTTREHPGPSLRVHVNYVCLGCQHYERSKEWVQYVHYDKSVVKCRRVSDK